MEQKVPMSKMLTLSDIRLGSVWLEVSLTGWKLLRQSWDSRKEYLGQDGSYEAALSELFRRQAMEFVAIQREGSLSEAGWERYRAAGYDWEAVLPNEAWPSVEVVRRRVEGLSQALSEAYRLGRNRVALPESTLQSLVKQAWGEESSLPSAHATQLPLVQALLGAVEENLRSGVSPLILAAWAHHAILQIRPYTEANAHTALLLTNYLLGHEENAPLLLWREQRGAYLKALQAADQGEIRPWMNLYAEGIQQAVLYLLSWGFPPNTSFSQGLAVYQRRLTHWRNQQNRDRSQAIMNNRYTVFDYMEEILSQIATELGGQSNNGDAQGIRALVAKAYPDSPYYHQFTGEIANYTRTHRYVFNRSLPRGWFKLKFYLSAHKRCQLVLPIHHVGHDDATLAVGALLHYLEPLKYQRKRRPAHRRAPQKEKMVYLYAPLPLERAPLAFNISGDVAPARPLLENYVRETLGLVLTELANQIY